MRLEDFDQALVLGAVIFQAFQFVAAGAEGATRRRAQAGDILVGFEAGINQVFSQRADDAIAPGYFSTNNTTALRADEDRSRDILARIPAGRWGTPADIGGAAVFLSSSAADYVHGTLLAVDGGWLAR